MGGTQSRAAFDELIATLSQAADRWIGPEWGIEGDAAEADAFRALAHMLEGGLVGHFESTPEAPLFRRIVTPSRKFTGDNADAIYFDAPISDDYSYRITGNTNGAVYVSITVEVDGHSGGLAQRTAGVINDCDFDVDQDGRFEIFLGGPERARNWMALEPGASRLTTRHYFEESRCAASRADRIPTLTIERVGEGAVPPAPSDTTVAAGFRRVAEFVRSRTIGGMRPGERENAPFVSTTPNVFVPPVLPGDMGLAAFDAAYSLAPYLVGEDQALVIRGRWPRCRFANVTLWNRHMQSFDYANRSISLNRVQTVADDEGRFEIILAHRDPGVDNWLDTEGRAFGLVFWRFMLPEGEIDTPETELVPIDALRSKASP